MSAFVEKYYMLLLDFSLITSNYLIYMEKVNMASFLLFDCSHGKSETDETKFTVLECYVRL